MGCFPVSWFSNSIISLSKVIFWRRIAPVITFISVIFFSSSLSCYSFRIIWPSLLCAENDFFYFLLSRSTHVCWLFPPFLSSLSRANYPLLRSDTFLSVSFDGSYFLPSSKLILLSEAEMNSDLLCLSVSQRCSCKYEIGNCSLYLRRSVFIVRFSCSSWYILMAMW